VVLWRRLADLVAFTHGSYVLFLIVGAPLAVRFRGLVRYHLVAFGAALAVNLAHLDCPLTSLEKALDRAGGITPYEGGFNAHYLFHPLLGAQPDGRANLVMLSLLALPILGAYGALAVAHRPALERARRD
jgi:Protein of Unknown function (DUF2784)